ncbi:fimbrial protein [Serratia fonticola]|uniref:fimbrial protein n=1 Tax=Serratia fonticola TaxID=47917 RepID=UPI001C44F308|nr:fimbrial protein [Serratia fonticola]QXN64746.1 fimbrial protein [Serratia fonticola]
MNNTNALRFFISVFFILSGCKAYAFSCVGPQGSIPATGGVMNVTISSEPQITPNANIIFDLSTQVSCKNDDISVEDYAWASTGTVFPQSLIDKGFSGGILWYGGNYPFPIKEYTAKWKMPHPKGKYYYLPLKLYVSPVGAQGGVKINAGESLGVVFIRVSQTLISIRRETYQFNLFTEKDIFVPTGGCDVNNYNNLVVLDSKLPSEFSSYSKDVGLSLKCASSRKVTYTVQTAGNFDYTNKIFHNATNNNSAHGVGIQILTGANEILEPNKAYLIGQVNNSFQSLGLKAQYVATGQPFRPGNVEVNMTVIFAYP